MEAIGDIVVKRERDESVVHLINSDIDIQEKRLIRNEETKGFDRLMKTERENTAEPIVGLMIECADIKTEKIEDIREDPLENEDRTEVTNEIEEKRYTQDNDGCIMLESVDLKSEINEETGNDPLEDGDGGYKLENERCIVKLEDSKVYLLEDKALSTWMNEAQVLNFENNSKQILESDGVVTYLGESERDITERERDLTESERDMTKKERDSTKKEDNIVNCQRNEKGGQGVLKTKETRNKSFQNKMTKTSSGYPRKLSSLRNVTKGRSYRRHHCIDCGSYLNSSSYLKHRRRQTCTLVKSVCEHCGETFSRKDFQQHLAICAIKEKYKCQMCSKKFTSRFSLLEHYETHAGNDTSTVGQITVQSNGQIYSYSANTITSGEHLSLSGSGQSDSEGDDSQPKFKCQECDRKFSLLALLVSHSLAAHPSRFKTAGKYNCKICSLDFESQAMYFEHLTTHSKTKVTPGDIKIRSNLRRHYKCYSCCTVFHSHYKYIEHMLTHSKSKNETESHLEGNSYESYIKHKLMHSKSKPKSPAISSQQNSGKQDDSGQISSNHLGNSNELSNSLDDNTSKLIKNCTQNIEKHSDLPNCQGTSDKHHKSNSSEDSTSLKHNLNLKIPSRPGTSNVHIETPKHFSRSQAKNKRRLESIDAGDSPYKIPKCPEEVESEKKQKLHEYVRLNYNEERFVCQVCHIEFKTQMACSSHELVHFGYQCQKCFEWFRTINDLSDHQPTHYKLKCRQCGERFQSNERLYRHAKKHPNKPGDDHNTGKHECWMCLEVFGTKGALLRHKSLLKGSGSFKGSRSSKCSKCNKVFWSACSLSQHMNTHNTTTVTPQ